MNTATYDNSAQKFVDGLNMKTMPQYGYVFRNNRREWPDVVSGYWQYRETWCGPLVSTGVACVGDWHKGFK